jgi:hypothetical protein
LVEKPKDDVPGNTPEALRNRLLKAATEVRERLEDVEGAIDSMKPPDWTSVNQLEVLLDDFFGDVRLFYFRLTGHHFQDGTIKRED